MVDDEVPESLRAIMLSLMRIEEMLAELLGEAMTMAKKKISPETRAVLQEIRAEVRALIEFVQSKLDAPPPGAS